MDPTIVAGAYPDPVGSIVPGAYPDLEAIVPLVTGQVELTIKATLTSQ